MSGRRAVAPGARLYESGKRFVNQRGRHKERADLPGEAVDHRKGRLPGRRVLRVDPDAQPPPRGAPFGRLWLGRAGIFIRRGLWLELSHSAALIVCESARRFPTPE